MTTNRITTAAVDDGVTLGKLYPFPALQPDVFYIDYIGILVSMGLVDLMDHRWNRIPLQIWYPGNIEEDILMERITRGFDRTSFNVIKFFFRWGTNGKFISSDGQIDFEDHIRELRIPILFVNGDRDYGVPEKAVQEAFNKAGSADKIFQTFGMENSGHHWGHCDLICGKHAPAVTWPYMLNWLEERIE